MASIKTSKYMDTQRQLQQQQQQQSNRHKEHTLLSSTMYIIKTKQKRSEIDFFRTKPNNFISVFFVNDNENANVHSEKAFMWQNMVDLMYLALDSVTPHICILCIHSILIDS